MIATGPTGEEQVELGPEMREQVVWEQMRLLRRQMPMLLAAVVANALLLTAVFRDHAHPAVLGAWLGAVVILSLVRWLGLRYFDSDSTMERNRRFWQFFFVLGSTLSGLLWGAAGMLFLLPQDTVLFSFLVILLAGMTAGSLASLSVVPWAHQGYTIGTMFPLTLAVIGAGREYLPVALLCLVFMLAMLVFSRAVHRALVGYLILQFRNLELVNELRVASEQAEAANLAKSRFLAAASHDLRQPLHALGLFLDLLGRSETPAQREEAQGKMQRSVEALSQLLDGLLDVSRLDAGQVPARRVHLRIDDLVAQVIEEYRGDAEGQGMSIEQISCGEVVYSDPLLLRRILDNLVGNALRHAARGRVTVGCRPANDGIEVFVEDQGPGIPEAEQQAVFREFHQLQNPERRREKGLGLGLAIVQRLAELLGMKVVLRSAPGQGCRFSFVVPRGDAQQISSIRPTESMADAPLFSGCRVLLVEDDAIVREAMGDLLAGWGCHIRAFADMEALEDDSEAGLDSTLVIADQRLPRKRNGYEAIALVRRRQGREVPALVITGETDSRELEQQELAGIPVLHKPVRPPRLRVAMQQLLEGSALAGRPAQSV